MNGVNRKVETRNTRKSRLVAEMAEAVCDLVVDGNRSPSKTDIVQQVVNTSLSASASNAIRAMLEDETANTLERYFADVCKAAAESMGGMAYHLVSKSYYKAGSRIPRDMEETQRFVVVFGNGRQDKAAGVRFPTADDEPDAMLTFVTQRDIAVTEAALRTHRERITGRIESPAIGQLKREQLRHKMGLATSGHVPQALPQVPESSQDV